MSLDYNEAAWIVCEAAREAGLTALRDPYAQQSKTSLQYGYSFIYFGDGGVRARKEGEGVLGKTDIGISYDEPDWVEKCVAILKVGRTIECGAGVGMETINQRVHYQTVDYDIKYLKARVGDTFDINPDYQREHVWTKEQRELFLGFFLENGRMPLIFLQDDNDWVTPFEVIDGKQRLTSCVMFIDGEVCARLSDGRSVWWRDFNERDRRMVPSIKCGIVRLESRAEVLRFYLKLNRGGTVHSDEEIARVQALLDEATEASW